MLSSTWTIITHYMHFKPRFNPCNSHGALNVLVNNASKQYACKDFTQIDLEKVEDLFHSNILQMIAVTKYALPHMSRGDSYVTPVMAYTVTPRLTTLQDHQ